MTRPAFELTGRAVCISCTDRHRTGEFYRRVLGAEVVPTEQGSLDWMRIGNLVVTIVPNAERPMPYEIFPEQAMSYLMLETADLRGARRHCESLDVEIDEWHEDQFMTVMDPDGLPIEIWQTGA